MRLLLALTLALGSLCVLAQNPAPAAKTEDVKSIDSIIGALYDVISGPPGAKHDWDRLRSLFAGDAKMVAIGGRGPKVGSRTLTVDEYIKIASPVIEKGGFVEKEIARHTDQFANMAHVYTTYESRILATDAKPFARGINSIELFNDGARWWIADIRWQEENQAHPLPEKYLHGS